MPRSVSVDRAGEHRRRQRRCPRRGPSGPTRWAKSRVKLPVPQATSSTPSPGDEPEQQPGDPVLVLHARPQHALGDAPERGAPPALVDRAGRRAVSIRFCVGPVDSGPAGADQVEVAVGPRAVVGADGAARRVAQRRGARVECRSTRRRAHARQPRSPATAGPRRSPSNATAPAARSRARPRRARDGPPAGRRSGCGCGCGSAARSAGWRRPSAGARPRPSARAPSRSGARTRSWRPRTRPRRAGLDRDQLGDSSMRALRLDRDRVLVAEDPHLVVDACAAGRSRSPGWTSRR